MMIMGMAVIVAANPWYVHTKHKPIKRMTRKEVHYSQIGRPLYERVNGKVVKNLRTPWSTVKKPTNYNAFHNKEFNHKKKRK